MYLNECQIIPETLEIIEIRLHRKRCIASMCINDGGRAFHNPNHMFKQTKRQF